MDPAFRDRAPKLVIDKDGKERLLVEDQILGILCLILFAPLVNNPAETAVFGATAVTEEMGAVEATGGTSSGPGAGHACWAPCR